MKRSFRHMALITACTALGTLFLPACTTESEMTDEDLAALREAITAAYAYEDSYSVTAKTDTVTETAYEGGTEELKYNLVETLTYSKDSGIMADYAELIGEYITTYTDDETGELVTESEDSVLKSGDYVIPENGVYNEYVYSFEGGSSADDVETSITQMYEYATTEELGGYISYKCLGNAFNHLLSIDFSSVNDYSTVEELKNYLLETYAGDSETSGESVTYEIFTGKKKGETYYHIGASATSQDGEETYELYVEFSVDGGYLTSVSYYVNYSLGSSSSDDEEEWYTYKIESLITADISYSYNSEIVPPESELSLYAKAN